jgi:hypothetical protein
MFWSCARFPLAGLARQGSLDSRFVVATIIAAVAVVIALGSYWVARQTDRRSRMPVLCIFGIKGGWRLENIGNGPALNIVIAQGRGPVEKDGVIWRAGVSAPWWSEPRAGLALRRDGIGPGESWSNPIHLPPLRAGVDLTILWPFSSCGVGISYTDALGRSYTLRMSRTGSRLTERRSMPKWQPTETVGLADIGKMVDGIWGERP